MASRSCYPVHGPYLNVALSRELLAPAIIASPPRHKGSFGNNQFVRLLSGPFHKYGDESSAGSKAVGPRSSEWHTPNSSPRRRPGSGNPACSGPGFRPPPIGVNLGHLASKLSTTYQNPPFPPFTKGGSRKPAVPPPFQKGAGGILLSN